MIRYFLRNSKQEVKIGDRITISVPTSTPYGQAKCEVDVLVTQESLQQLVKDGLVVKQEETVITLEDYKPFIRRLARRMNITYPEATDLLDVVKKISIYAHNVLLKELMADVFNKDKIDSEVHYYVTHYGTVAGPSNIPSPSFISRGDAVKAFNLLKPFYEEASRRKESKQKGSECP